LICAICHGDGSRLCRPCRKDPANSEWVDKWPGVVISETLARRERIRQHAAWTDPVEEQGGKAPDAEAFVTSLLVLGVPEKATRRDRHGHSRGAYERRRYVGVRTIAKALRDNLGVRWSRMKVYRLRRRLLRDLGLV
jgi:hypothetical protein